MRAVPPQGDAPLRSHSPHRNRLFHDDPSLHSHSLAPTHIVSVAPAGASLNGATYLARQDLGSNTVESLEVAGTRETLPLNSGVAGNKRALVSTREFWYSPELETNLAVTRNAPREVLQVVRLSSFSRSES